MDEFGSSRRTLLRGICYSVAGLGAVTAISACAAEKKSAPAADKKAASKPASASAAKHPSEPLREDEPIAKAVEYQYAAYKVDRKQHPTYKPGQSCNTCKLMEQGTAIQRECSLFPGRLVNGGGWCNVWTLRGT